MKVVKSSHIGAAIILNNTFTTFSSEVTVCQTSLSFHQPANIHRLSFTSRSHAFDMEVLSTFHCIRSSATAVSTYAHGQLRQNSASSGRRVRDLQRNFQPCTSACRSGLQAYLRLPMYKTMDRGRPRKQRKLSSMSRCLGL
jgi:hypothetical protein